MHIYFQQVNDMIRLFINNLKFPEFFSPATVVFELNLIFLLLFCYCEIGSGLANLFLSGQHM